MKLLVLTQKVDRNDPVLGFFHGWLEAFATRFEKLSVIALGVGEYALPKNVGVYSLGKEGGVSRIKYLWRFYKYIWKLRRDYDAVLVHMNQEYVILGWKHWFLMGKPIFLWRNHAQGNFLTRLAVALSKKVFCTSPESYTARFKKTLMMPAGIDTDFFKADPNVLREPRSVLFLGRLSPVKRALEFVEWFKTLGDSFSATVAGAPTSGDEEYAGKVRRAAPANMRFVGAVTQDEALRLYQSHELYVNLTPAGSLDKTILEAAACEMGLKVENPALKALEGKSGKEAREYVIGNHSLELLVRKLKEEII